MAESLTRDQAACGVICYVESYVTTEQHPDKSTFPDRSTTQGPVEAAQICTSVMTGPEQTRLYHEGSSALWY